MWRARDADPAAWDLLLHPRTLDLFTRTATLAVAVTAVGAVVAVPLAWLTVASDLPGRRLWTVALCLPLAVPSYISGYVLLAAFGDGGLLDRWGWPRPDVYGFSGAVLALTASTFPLMFLSCRAALASQDPSLVEAARALGRPPGLALAAVSWPPLARARGSSGLVVAFYVLSDFGAVSLLQYDTFSRAIYMQLEGAFDRSLAALWSLALVAPALALLVLSAVAARRGPQARAGRAATRRPRPVALGPWTAPALGGCALIVAAAVGLPVAVIGWWAAQGGRGGALLDPALTSLTIAAVTAVVTVVGSLPLGYLAARSPSPAARLLERVSYAAYALPPIVVALSLVSFGIHVASFAYGTLAMLVFAHVVRFGPLALGTSKGGFAALSPRLGEAAASLGRAPLAVATRVALPLLRADLAAGAALVFLSVMKELPATLLLGPIGLDTLPRRIWTAAGDGNFAAAASPALVLIALSSLGVALTLRHERAAEQAA